MDELSTIVARSADILGVAMGQQGAMSCPPCEGTPRIANRLLRRVRDYAEIKADGKISAEVADQALNMLNVDANGFDHMDRRLMLTIMQKARWRACGGGQSGRRDQRRAGERSGTYWNRF